MERKIEKPLVSLSGREAMQELIDYILGEDWYVVDSLSQSQINAIAVDEIERKFAKLTNRKLKSKWNKIVDKLKFK